MTVVLGVVDPEITCPIKLRMSDGRIVDVPDPMNLDPWIEQDEPLASDFHRFEQIRVFDALVERFPLPDAYVLFERWLVMRLHDRVRKVQPDLLVAIGVPHLSHDEYDPANEGKAPDVLMEWLSPSSLTADLVEKPRDYAQLGVREYFVFNPAGRFAVSRIQGWRLRPDGKKEALPVASDGGVASEVLPVRFAIVQEQLLVFDRDTGEPLTALEAERRLRLEAEAEVQRLRKLLEER